MLQDGDPDTNVTDDCSLKFKMKNEKDKSGEAISVNVGTSLETGLFYTNNNFLSYNPPSEIDLFRNAKETEQNQDYNSEKEVFEIPLAGEDERVLQDIVALLKG